MILSIFDVNNDRHDEMKRRIKNNNTDRKQNKTFDQQHQINRHIDTLLSAES